jgi:4-hydroxy-2-oxoheptanedioate aldolase
MQSSIFRRKAAEDEVYLCAKACYQDPEIVEIFGRQGFDGAWICLEHRRLDPSVVASLIQGCRLGGLDAIFRLRPANYADLLPLLEGGVRGIMLPRVRTLAEVSEVVSAMKFYPAGRRGFDGIHAEADFGLTPPEQYMAEANRANFLIVQIEEMDVMPHLDAIAALPGVDVLFVGPGDLTINLGKHGRADDPEVAGVIRRVAEAARRHGKIAGIPCSPSRVAHYHQLGYRFFNVVSDYRCLINGLAQAKADALRAVSASAKSPPPVHA